MQLCTLPGGVQIAYSLHSFQLIFAWKTIKNITEKETPTEFAKQGFERDDVHSNWVKKNEQCPVKLSLLIDPNVQWKYFNIWLCQLFLNFYHKLEVAEVLYCI